MLFALVDALGSYVLRLETWIRLSFFISRRFIVWQCGLIVKPVVYYFFGLYRRLWVYASIRELKLIVLAVTTASVVVSVVMIVSIFGAGFHRFPRSVLDHRLDCSRSCSWRDSFCHPWCCLKANRCLTRHRASNVNATF